MVRDAAGTATGTYALSVQRLNDPVGCATLSYGAAPRVGTIATDGETDCYRFAAAAGDRVHVRLEGTSAGLSPVGEVLNPDGTRACPPTTADESSCLLSAASGTYTILAGDAAGTNHGDYALAVQRLNNPVGCTTLAFATLPTPAAIGAAREVDCFRFDGAAGDRVRVSAITLAGNAVLAEVVGPDGSTRCRTSGPRFTCALDRSGGHTMFVVSDSRVQTSTYSVLIQRLNDPVACRSIAFGAAPIQASVTWAAETDCYRLDGGAGALARLVFTGLLRYHVVVLRPDGTQRCEARYPLSVLGFSCAFDASGAHTILVEDDSGTLAGGYTIASQRANYCGAGHLYVGGDAERGSIAAGEVDCWDIGGLDAGRRVEVRLTREGGALDPVAEFLRPDGTRLCGPTTADEFVCVTDTTGGNHLLIGGTRGRGAYEIELS